MGTTGAPMRAELIEDAGAAACSPDFFRSSEFLAAEGTTHTVRIESTARVALAPLIVRPIPGTEHSDAISPYAYPGSRIEGVGPAPDPVEIEWSATGLVSVFIRDRLGEPSMAGGRERSRVQVHDPGRERRVRSRLAEQVRAVARAGWRVETLSGPEAGSGAADAFERAYEETMRRAGAAERYFFGRAYYEAVLRFPESWLLLARDPAGETGAAAIAALSDGFLHYYLGGTSDASLDASPFKLVVSAMLDLADELRRPLNLGGGVTPGDGLERFKRGFANAELPFRTHEIICDADAYTQLSGGRDAGGFFPAYRAS